MTKEKAATVAVTEERAAAMIAEAISGLAEKQALQVLVTGAELEEKLKGLVNQQELSLKLDGMLKMVITEEQVRGIFAEEFDAALAKAEPARLSDPSVLELAEKPPLDPALLKGLVFRDARLERRVVDGRPKMVPTKIERPLLPSDVLSYRVDGDQLLIVTADGQKHTVEL